MKYLMIISLSLLTGLGVPPEAEEAVAPRKVSWDDLKAKFEFEDPFEKLSEKQLLDLGIIARVQALEKLDGGRKVSDGMRKEATEARKRLEQQKVDIDGLFAKRQEITELRRQRGSATVPGLDGVLLALPGFVLPLEYEDRKVTEFLLVPWVGACIHTPPPPPNQIVHVTAREPFEIRGMFEAVSVTAAMKIGGVTKNLFLVDGTANINMSYSMKDAEVREYKKEPRPDGGVQGRRHDLQSDDRQGQRDLHGRRAGQADDETPVRPGERRNPGAKPGVPEGGGEK